LDGAEAGLLDGAAVEFLNFFLAGKATALTVDCSLALRFLTTRVLASGFLAFWATGFSVAAGFSSSSSSLQQRTLDKYRNNSIGSIELTVPQLQRLLLR
jgi:hypothetical protein